MKLYFVIFQLLLTVTLSVTISPVLLYANDVLLVQGDFEIRYLEDKRSYVSKRWVRLQGTGQEINRTYSDNAGLSWSEDGTLRCEPTKGVPKGLLADSNKQPMEKGLRCQYVDMPPPFANHYYWFLKLPIGTKLNYLAPEWVDEQSKYVLTDEVLQNLGKPLVLPTTEVLTHVIEIRGMRNPYNIEQLRPTKR